MLIFRFMISFLVSTRVALHASMLKKASVFTCWPVQQHSPSLSEMLYFNPPPPNTQSVLTGQLTDT